MKKYSFTAKIVARDGGGTGVLFPYDTQELMANRPERNLR
jgi:hypothetical protein